MFAVVVFANFVQVLPCVSETAVTTFVKLPRIDATTKVPTGTDLVDVKEIDDATVDV